MTHHQRTTESSRTSTLEALQQAAKSGSEEELDAAVNAFFAKHQHHRKTLDEGLLSILLISTERKDAACFGPAVENYVLYHQTGPESEMGLLRALSLCAKHKQQQQVELLLDRLGTLAVSEHRSYPHLSEALAWACRHGRLDGDNTDMLDILIPFFLSHVTTPKYRYDGLHEVFKACCVKGCRIGIQRILPLLLTADSEYHSEDKQDFGKFDEYSEAVQATIKSTGQRYMSVRQSRGSRRLLKLIFAYREHHHSRAHGSH